MDDFLSIIAFSTLLFVQFLLIMAFLKEYLIKRVKLLLLLIFAFSFSFIFNVIAILVSEVPEFSIDEIVLSIPLILALIISTFLFYLFFTLFENPSPDLKEMIFYSITLGISIPTIPVAMFLFSSILTESENENIPDEFTDLVSNPEAFLILIGALILGILFIFCVFTFLVITPIKIIRIIRRIQRNIEIEGSDNYNLILGGFLLFFFSRILQAIFSDELFLGGLLVFTFILMDIVGQGLILYTFTTRESFVFSAHRLDNLILLNDAGLVLYNYKFAGSKARVNELLIGGILSALNKTMEEIVGSTKNLEAIKLGDLHIIFRQINAKYLFILITKRSSRFIEEVLSNFTEDFAKRYSYIFDELETKTILSSNHFEDALNLVVKYFSISGIHQPLKENPSNSNVRLNP